MAILIPDMEMPESCYYCPFADGSWGNFPHEKICVISGEVMPRDARGIQYNHPFCPLIEVHLPTRNADMDRIMTEAGWE